MLKINILRSYKKDFKRLKNSGRFNQEILKEVVLTLLNEKQLSEKYRDHQLSGRLSHARECHIEGDLLLVYEIDKRAGKLHLINLGSHSDLF